jgi:hypothetical protein
MNKRKIPIIVVVLLLTSAFILLFINRTNLSNENYLLKNRQGEVIQGNILWVQTAISYAQEDLGEKDVSISKLYRDYWKFNEFAMFDLPRRGVVGYLINIRNDFNELIELRENKLSQQEIDVVKIRLQTQLSKLQEALVFINKECGNANIKYYFLNSDGNETMQNVLKILIEEDNIYNKK